MRYVATTTIAALLAGTAMAQTPETMDEAPADNGLTTMEAEAPVDAGGSMDADSPQAADTPMDTEPPVAAQDGEVSPAMDANAPMDGGAADTYLARPSMTIDGYSDMDREALTAEDLEGAPVYSSSDEEIGEVSSLLLDADGQISDVVVDVGGFLGIGEKAVALGLDETQIVQGEAGDVRVYVDATEEALESRPEHME